MNVKHVHKSVMFTQILHIEQKTKCFRMLNFQPVAPFLADLIHRGVITRSLQIELCVIRLKQNTSQR